MEIRLNKYLSQRGAASRRAADRMIQEGRIAVNGSVVLDLGHKIDDGRDQVTIDGRLIKAGRELVYLMLNKPKGFLVTLADPLGRATIKNLIRTLPAGVHSVGRLDKDSEGLLLLTNDGELTNRLTHPRFEVPKIYLVRVEGKVTPEEIGRLARGVPIEGGPTAPAKVRVLESGAKTNVLRFEIHEGRKREVRQMCESVGHDVIRLMRVSFAGLSLGNLAAGQWRFLKNDEIRKLKRLAGMT